MSVLNVALIGSDEFARSLGKKGDSRDIDSYVHKESKDGGVRVLSLLRPLKHPESIRPLLSVLDVAKAGLLEMADIFVVNKADHAGEHQLVRELMDIAEGRPIHETIATEGKGVVELLERLLG